MALEKEASIVPMVDCPACGGDMLAHTMTDLTRCVFKACNREAAGEAFIADRAEYEGHRLLAIAHDLRQPREVVKPRPGEPGSLVR